MTDYAQDLLDQIENSLKITKEEVLEIERLVDNQIKEEVKEILE